MKFVLLGMVVFGQRLDLMILEAFSKLSDPVILWRPQEMIRSQSWCHPRWSHPLKRPAPPGISHPAQDPLSHTMRGKKAASSCQDQLAQELQ